MNPVGVTTGGREREGCGCGEGVASVVSIVAGIVNRSRFWTPGARKHRILYTNGIGKSSSRLPVGAFRQLAMLAFTLKKVHKEDIKGAHGCTKPLVKLEQAVAARHIGNRMRIRETESLWCFLPFVNALCTLRAEMWFDKVHTVTGRNNNLNPYFQIIYYFIKEVGGDYTMHILRNIVADYRSCHFSVNAMESVFKPVRRFDIRTSRAPKNFEI